MEGRPEDGAKAGAQGEKDEEMKQVISRLGAKFGRPQKELDELVERLTQNWITHLSHWKALPQAQREQFKLPLLLLHELAHIIGEDEDAGQAMAVCPPPQRPSTKRSRTEKVDKKGKDIDVEAPVKRAKMHGTSSWIYDLIVYGKFNSFMVCSSERGTAGGHPQPQVCTGRGVDGRGEGHLR